MGNGFSKLFSSLQRALAWTARWARRFVRGKREDAPHPRVYWDDNVSLTLSNLARETETRASGRVQLITLADFREAIGELWDRYENKILIIVESTIGRMIGKGNTYIPQDDDTWLLLFPDLSEDMAQQRADAIAASIGEKLLGAQFSAHEAPLPTASKLDLTGALNADGSLNMEAVKAAISRIRRTQITAVAASNRPARHAASRAPVSPAGTLVSSNAEQLKPFFRPAWCAETESIDTFFFRANADTGVNVYSDPAPPINDATVLDLTKTATTAFTAMCDSGLQAKMAIPVPFDTLRCAALSEFQRLIAGVRQRDRLLRLRLEVVRIPSEAAADTLIAIRELFRPYVREVAFMINLRSPHDQVLVLDHIMLGVDLTDTAIPDEEVLFQEMLMFRQRAGRRGTYVLGLNTRAHLKRAINAGISEIGGGTLLEDIKRLPHRIAIVHREEILAP